MELADARIADLLDEEENRGTYAFVGRTTFVTEILELFASRLALEAVLITQNGEPKQGLLGIATQWDAMRHLDALS